MPGSPPTKPSLEAYVKRANEVGKTYVDAAKDQKALGDALKPLFTDLEQHFPEAIEALKSAATTGTLASLVGTPVFGAAVGGIVFMIRLHLENKKKAEEKTRNQGIDRAISDQQQEFKTELRWFADRLGVEDRHYTNLAEFLAEVAHFEGEESRRQATEIDLAQSERLQNYFNWLAEYLKPRFAELQDELSELRAQAVWLCRTLADVQPQLKILVDHATSGYLSLELIEAGPPSDENDLLFYQRSTPMLGREDELNRLRQFCDHDGTGRPLRFWIVSGTGGVGKTRLAHELCLEYALKGWDVGFLVGGETPRWSSWRPSRDTLIVVDYFLARRLDWKTELQNLSHRTKGKKVRILLVERTADVQNWAELLPRPELRPVFHGEWSRDEHGRERLEALEIAGLDTEKLRELFALRADWPSQERLNQAVTQFEEIDPQRRALFALLAADALAEALKHEKDLPQWEFEDFVDNVLNKVFDRWVKGGIDRAHGYLFALATMVGKLDLTDSSYAAHREALPSILPRTPDPRQCIRLAAYSGSWNPDEQALLRLLPDALGEAFVIAVLDGRWARHCAAQGPPSIGTAWMPDVVQSNGDALVRYAEAVANRDPVGETMNPFVDFLRRTAGDFESKFSFFRAITSLNLSGTSVACIDFLQNFTALTNLDLQETQVANITPLRGLIALTILNLRGTEVANVTPLQGLTALTHLSLGGTQVTDITPLQGLNALINLNLEGIQVADVTPLQGLNALKYLKLDGTQVANITPLRGLSRLKYLYLRRIKVTKNQVKALEIALPNCTIVF